MNVYATDKVPIHSLGSFTKIMCLLAMSFFLFPLSQDTFAQGDPGCPTVLIDVNNLAFPTQVCVGSPLEICLDTDGMGDLSQIEVSGITVAGGPDPGFTITPNGTQICINTTPLSGADPCAPYDLEITLGGANIITTDPACSSGLVGINATNVPIVGTFTNNDINNALPLLGLAGADPIVVTIYPTYNVAVVDPVCDGTGGSATLQADGSDCDTETVGTPGITNVCPATDDVDATLSYDFTAAVDPLACVNGELTGDISIDCAIICPTCPTVINEPILGGDLCYDNDVVIEPLLICYEFDDDPSNVNLTVNGIPAFASGINPNILCVESIELPVPNCDIATLDFVVEADCEGNPVTGLTTGNVGTLTVYPDPDDYVIDIQASAGCGEVPIITDSTCPSLTAQGYAGADPVDGCPPTTSTYEWTHTPPTFPNAPCQYPDQSGSEDITGCDTCIPCPTQVTGITFPSEICAPDIFEVCLEFDAVVSSSTSIAINGVTATGVAGGTQICVNIPTVDNQTCAPVPQSLIVDAACDGSPVLVSVTWIDPQVYPEPFTLDLVQPECDGVDGSATVLAVNGDVCDTATGAAGTTAVCPQTVGTPATLAYNFGPYFEGTACEQAGFSDDISIACDATCNCPAGATPLYNVENCSGDDVEICLDFETTVDASIVATIFGQVIDGSAGGTQICATTTITNETCDAIALDLDMTATCNGEPITIIIPFVPPSVYPAPFTVDVVQPECEGAAGSASVLAVNGDVCDSTTGTAGTNNVCPETVGTPATLAYNFGPYFEGTACEQAGFSDDISIACDVACADCVITDAAVADIACDDNGTSEDPDDDTFTFTLNVTGANTGAGWTANDPNATTGAYGSAVSFGPYSIAGGALSFTITDDTDPNCTFAVQVAPPATCSTPVGECDEVAGTVSLTPATDCGGGIGIGPYTIDASGAANGITVYIVGDPTVGDINDDGIADTAIVQLTSNINDIIVNDTLCVTPFTYDEADFAAFIVAVNDLCNTPPFDQFCGAIGLPFPTNTTLEEVFDLLGGLAQLTITDVLELINYGQGGQIDLGGILGLPLPVIIDIPTICYDLGEPVCVTPVDECPAVCIITSANVGNVLCSDNGTDTDPSDDLFTFDVIVSGTNFGSGWTANDPNATSGSYNLATNFGPYPISGGALTFTITDNDDPNCTFEVTVNPPETCSTGGTGCNLIAGTVEINGSSICSDGTEIGPFSVNFTPGIGNGVNQLTLTDGAGNIITVANSATEAQDSINNAFGTICVTPFMYDQEDLDSLIVTINDAVVGIGGPPVLSAGSTIGDLLNALNGLLGAGGGAVPLTIADLDALLNGGAGGSTDIGAILGLPPGLLVIDLPPLCYTIGETVCVDPVDSCPCNANNGVFPFKGN